MKNIILILFVVFTGCSASTNLVITKKYVGKYISTYQTEEEYIVTTTMGIFKVREYPENIPDSALCYLRREPCLYDYHPDISRQLEKQYFTWHNSDKEYELKKKIDFRKLK